MNNTQTTISLLSKISVKSLENLELITEYIDNSLSNGTEITFYNWECPPRFIDKGKGGDVFVNYCVDLASIARGDKIDCYTEIPRVVERADDEQKILRYLKESKVKFRFVKLIADTNALYITPKSATQLGESQITKAHQDFKQFVADRVREYPVPVKVFLFTKLIEPFQRKYDKAFQEALSLLEEDDSKLVSEEIYNAQRERTRDHVGLTDYQQIESFTKRTIATYAAEGMIFNELSKTDYFSNCVWLNIEEADDRTVAITNSLRRKNKLGCLPMVFAS